MATRLGNDTAYSGTNYGNTRPRTEISETQVELLASDQASVYQTLIGKDLTGNALSTLTPHVHDGTTGCTLPMPLSVIHNRLGDDDTELSGENEAASPRIYPDQLDTDYPQRMLYHWPVFAPAGVTSARVYVRGNEHLIDMYPTMHVDSTVGQYDTAYQLSYDDPLNPRVFYYDITLTGGAVNYLTLMLNQGWNAGGTARVYQVDVMPQRWRAVRSAQDAIPGVGTLSGALVDRIDGSAFLPIWDTFTAAGKPVTSYVTGKLAANNAYIHKLVTDTSAPGFAGTPTPRGHDHDNGTSALIDVPLYSACLGSARIDTAAVDGFITTEVSDSGAPTLDFASLDTYKTLAHAVIAVPRKDSATTVTATWVATLHDEDGNQARLKMYSGATPNATTNSDEPAATADGAGWYSVSGTITLGDAGLYYIRLDGKLTDANGYPGVPSTPKVSVTGLAVYLT